MNDYFREGFEKVANKAALITAGITAPIAGVSGYFYGKKKGKEAPTKEIEDMKWGARKALRKGEPISFLMDQAAYQKDEHVAIRKDKHGNLISVIGDADPKSPYALNKLKPNKK